MFLRKCLKKCIKELLFLNTNKKMLAGFKKYNIFVPLLEKSCVWCGSSVGRAKD
jgi:hypothetical protein